MKASDLFVQCLEHEGIEYIFGVTGEENADFVQSLQHSERIRFILTRPRRHRDRDRGQPFVARTELKVGTKRDRQASTGSQCFDTLFASLFPPHLSHPAHAVPDLLDALMPHRFRYLPWRELEVRHAATIQA